MIFRKNHARQAKAVQILVAAKGIGSCAAAIAMRTAAAAVPAAMSCCAVRAAFSGTAHGVEEVVTGVTVDKLLKEQEQPCQQSCARMVIIGPGRCNNRTLGGITRGREDVVDKAF